MYTPLPQQQPPWLKESYAPERGFRRVTSIAACLIIVSFGIWLMFSHLPALIISIPIVAINLGSTSHTLYILTPIATVIPIISLSGFSLYLYFFGIVTAIILSLLWVFKNEFKEFVSIITTVLEHGKRYPLESKNSCMLIPQLFIALMFFSIVYFYLLQFFGIQIKSPDFKAFPLWEFLFSMVDASFYEEIAARVIPIGIPLLILHTIFWQKRERTYKYFFGGNFEINKLSVFLIIISAIIFGIAHVRYGWDWYKFPQTFMVGIALGYLFLKKGLHTSILLHFAVDFSSALPMILFRYTSNISIYPSPFYLFALGFGLISTLSLIAMITLGILLSPIFFGYYTKDAIRTFYSVLQKQPNISNESNI